MLTTLVVRRELCRCSVGQGLRGLEEEVVFTFRRASDRIGWFESLSGGGAKLSVRSKR